MALDSKENLKKPISKELSDYIRKHTTVNDRIKVCDMQGVNIRPSTLQAVVYCQINLTQDNRKGLIELMRIAIMNNTEGLKAGRNYLKNI
jgi:hypothetical protein